MNTEGFNLQPAVILYRLPGGVVLNSREDVDYLLQFGDQPFEPVVVGKDD